MKKIGLLCLALVVALGTFGVSYAMWSDSVTLSGPVNTGSVEWEFMGPVVNLDPCVTPPSVSNDWNCFYDLYGGDWELMGKDVACTDVVISSPDTLTVTVNNAYPYYGNHIAFKVHGLGSIPLRFWKLEFYRDGILIDETYVEDKYVYLDYNADDKDDLQLWWGDNLGSQLEYCNKLDMSFELLVLQPAEQNATYTFTMKLIAVQWNEYVPGPITP